MVLLVIQDTSNQKGHRWKDSLQAGRCGSLTNSPTGLILIRKWVTGYNTSIGYKARYIDLNRVETYLLILSYLKNMGYLSRTFAGGELKGEEGVNYELGFVVERVIKSSLHPR